MKLNHKIFLYFGSFSLIIVLFFLMANYFVIQRSLHDRGRRDLLQLVKSTDLAVENFLDTAIRNYLRSLVEQNLIVLNDLYQKVESGDLTEFQAKEAFQQHVIKQKIGQSGYMVALRPQDSKIMIEIHPFARGTDCAFNQGCQDWVAQKNGYNEYEWKNPKDKQLRKKVGYFQYFKPWNWVVGATSYRDEFAQLIKIDDLKQFVSSFTILGKGYFVLLDDKLNFLIHPELKGKSGQDLQNIDGRFIVREIIQDPDRFHYYRWKNPSEKLIKKKFAYAKKLEDFNWYLVATGYMEDVTLPVDKLMRTSYAMIAVLAILFVILTYFFSRGLSRPLNELIQGLNSFYKKKAVFKMTSRSVKEVEEVGHAIEDMTKALVETEKENKRMHEILLQGQKMEAIGTLAGGIAHDFNNILSGIFGFCELTKNNLATPQKAQEHIGNAIKGVRKATRLIQQILTFSRQSKNQKQVLKLSNIVEETMILVRASIPATIEIKQDLLPDDTNAILGDPTQIQQIIMNLCTNAYHAMMESSGILTVTLKEVEVKESDVFLGFKSVAGTYLRLEIKDTGHGMDQKTLEKVLDPYFTTKEVGKGTGLGLSMVSGIVQDHKGYLRIYSEPGLGSTFHVFFPVEKEKEPIFIEERETQSIRGGAENIMLVDDETDILSSMKVFFEEYGYTVSTFNDGQEALEAFENTPDRFDLIVTDITMPRLTGRDLAQKVLDINPKQKIIVCTGYSDLINKEQALAMGILDYFSKPVRVDTLLNAIRKGLDCS